jgi:hypothetical protein
MRGGLAHIAIAAVEEEVDAGVASRHRSAGVKVEGVVAAAGHHNQHHNTMPPPATSPHHHQNAIAATITISPPVHSHSSIAQVAGQGCQLGRPRARGCSRDQRGARADTGDGRRYQGRSTSTNAVSCGGGSKGGHRGSMQGCRASQQQEYGGEGRARGQPTCGSVESRRRRAEPRRVRVSHWGERGR